MEGHGRDQTVCEAASLATGLVYDEKLSRHYCAWNPAYTERPERIKECYARIQQLGLLERCVNIPVRPATNEEIELCHTRKHMDLLKETQYMTIEQLGTLSRSYDFVYFHKTVEENARLALGGAIDLVDHVVSGKLQIGMAVVRPPGHHAMSQQFCGYCYFNNIAVAARTALKKHGLKRILIVDWDVHHGQGTQFDFYNDPRVLFFSIHRYEHGMEWPYLRESDYDYVGEGEARGFNINVPLNEIGCDNSDYLSVFFNILLPVAYEFEPELVLVSAGYDSAIGCPEGQMSVTPACFAHFVKLLKPLAAGKLVLLLEGGYCLKTLAEGAALSLRALLGDPTPNISSLARPRRSVVESCLNTLTLHRAMHPSLAYQDLAEGENQVFRWQGSPPKIDMELRTKDKQPEIFPLIQQCCEHVPDATQEAISKEIERLEKDTVLTSTQHRLGITYYQTPTPVNSKSGSLEEVLSQRGLLSSCFKPSINSPLEESRISAAVGAIMDNTVQSCVMLPCCSDTVGQQSTDKQNVVKWTAKCLQCDFHVKRTLYLSFSSGNHPIIQSLEQKDHNRSLVISLGPCPAADDEVSPSCQPAPVCIPLSQSQLQDADIIAAVQQIVLPISYEFGPDFVVVCLDLFKPDLPGGPSAACIGHVLSVIQGLAMGRLLLLVSPEAMEEMEETVVECVSVLQGRPCHTVSACVPQSSTVELIKTVQDRQKAVWNVLHFREKLPPPR